MDAIDLLDDALSRVPEAVRERDRGPRRRRADLAARPEANPIGSLVWHLTRAQDAQIAPLAGVEELWTADGWAGRFEALSEAPHDHGYGWSPEDADALGAPPSRSCSTTSTR